VQVGQRQVEQPRRRYERVTENRLNS
jgi:hypothetical protein